MKKSRHQQKALHIGCATTHKKTTDLEGKRALVALKTKYHESHSIGNQGRIGVIDTRGSPQVDIETLILTNQNAQIRNNLKTTVADTFVGVKSGDTPQATPSYRMLVILFQTTCGG